MMMFVISEKNMTNDHNNVDGLYLVFYKMAPGKYLKLPQNENVARNLGNIQKP